MDTALIGGTWIATDHELAEMDRSAAVATRARASDSQRNSLQALSGRLHMWLNSSAAWASGPRAPKVHAPTLTLGSLLRWRTAR